MRALRCARAKQLIARKRAGLSAAERLKLEDHITSCTPCREEARALDAFARMIDEEVATSRPSRHARAITKVLNAASEPELAVPSSPPRSAPYLLAGAMAAAGVLGFAAYRAGWGGADTPSPGTQLAETAESAERTIEPLAEIPEFAPTEEEPARDRLASGDLRADGAPIELGEAVIVGAELSTDGGAELSLGPALVELEAGARAVWAADETTVRLHDGVVRARVDPEKRTTFLVLTDSFAVEVIGTVFEVTQAGVTVDKGAVRVTDRDGEVLAARVEAGESWQLEEPADEPVAPALNVGNALSQARSRLARADVAGARELIRQALAAGPSRVERAEAETLLAECALVAGDRARAARRYLAVAETYAKLSAGENALFAAARLERDLGREDRAAELFERYLSRYPTGRFRADAELRLQEARRK